MRCISSLLPAAVPAAALILAAVSAHAAPIDQTVPAKPDGDVHVSNVAGSVTVSVWDRNEVHVGGTLGRDAERVAVDTSGGGVDIRVVLPRNGRDHNIEGSDLTVQLPAGSHVSVETVSADVTATGLTGMVQLQTVSGDVELRSKAADITAKSVSGDVRIDGAAPQARVEAHSISGDVRLDSVDGELYAESVSGDIELDGTNTLKRCRFNTTSGSVDFRAALSAEGDCEFHSVSGDVTLDLPEAPNARFNVETFSGDIHSTFGPTPQRKSEYGPGKSWRYQASSGSARFDINTMSGDIRLSAPKP
ncbi:MAG TPA: DUF4097 family beta strand repeat-containing protein [Gammaproteobacteria bacterium]|nr:DUF4097 family beta strand repeat-containing protein [Gammaproteobacteria bacterium]